MKQTINVTRHIVVLVMVGLLIGVGPQGRRGKNPLC
jgi:hypothetical protein